MHCLSVPHILDYMYIVEIKAQRTLLVSEDVEVELTPIHRQRRSIPNDPPDELHAKFTTQGKANILKLERTKWRHDRVPFHYYSQGIKHRHVAEENPQVSLIFVKH